MLGFQGFRVHVPFFNAFPEQSVEVGIAEQNLVSISAGMARCGEKPYCFSPACFLSTRSYEQVNSENNCPFEMDRAMVHGSLDTENDVVIIACGEMVRPAIGATELLEEKGIRAVAVDMYCVKPLDREVVIKAARHAKLVLTVEEHAPYGGLGSAVAVEVAEHCPIKVVTMALPDDHVITGKSGAVFDYYGLNAEGIAEKAAQNLR